MDRALISQTALAELAGVTRGAVSLICKPGKKLHVAVVRGKIDRMHPAVQSYIHEQTTQRATRPYKKDPTAAATAGKTGSAKAKAARKASPPPSEPPPEVNPMDFLSEDVRNLADKPLRELVAIFGTDERFVDWLKAVHEMEKVQDRRIKNAVAEGVLIPRKIVKDHILGPINTLHERLMTDGARTIASHLYAMGKAGRTEREFEDYVIEYMGGFVRALKPKLLKAIRDA